MPEQLPPVLSVTENAGPSRGAGRSASSPRWRPVMLTRTGSSNGTVAGSARERRRGAYTEQSAPTKLHAHSQRPTPARRPSACTHSPWEAHGGSHAGVAPADRVRPGGGTPTGGGGGGGDARGVDDAAAAAGILVSTMDPGLSRADMAPLISRKVSGISGTITWKWTKTCSASRATWPVPSSWKVALMLPSPLAPLRPRSLLPILAWPWVMDTCGLKLSMPSGPMVPRRGLKVKRVPVAWKCTTAALSLTTSPTSDRSVAERVGLAVFQPSGVEGQGPSTAATTSPWMRGVFPSTSMKMRPLRMPVMSIGDWSDTSSNFIEHPPRTAGVEARSTSARSARTIESI
mmetsp:Transcript_9683/g.28353  ORF Transcript_9683/g.28353 Transcript_9683/m.28353 type:complete len:345 (-) Transcript_9683:22-1056(-)